MAEYYTAIIRSKTELSGKFPDCPVVGTLLSLPRTQVQSGSENWDFAASTTGPKNKTNKQNPPELSVVTS